MKTQKTNDESKRTTRTAVLMPADLRDRVTDIASREGLALGTWIRVQLIREVRRREEAQNQGC